MNWVPFVNQLLTQHGYRRYLQLGCAADPGFHHVSARFKVGVDPVSGGTLPMTHETFFRMQHNKRFDLIFIYDPTNQSTLETAFSMLLPGGMVITDATAPRIVEPPPPAVIARASAAALVYPPARLGAGGPVRAPDPTPKPPPVPEDPHDIPIIIIVRDRLSTLQRLVQRLESVGQRRIILLDNSSTYPPLLAYLEKSPHQVVRTGRNDGPASPWTSKVLADHDGHFIVTDPDMVPEDACPNDFIAVLLETVQKAPPRTHKVGLSLRIDDLPKNPVADHVRAHEAQFWNKTIGTGARGEAWYSAAIDTTFAIYTPKRGYDAGAAPAVRLGPPYTMRCDSWYMNLNDLSEEERYYCAHASGASSWVRLVREKM